MAKRMVNIEDVYEINTLKKTHPGLNFLQVVDECSGYRTKPNAKKVPSWLLQITTPKKEATLLFPRSEFLREK